MSPSDKNLLEAFQDLDRKGSGLSRPPQPPASPGGGEAADPAGPRPAPRARALDNRLALEVAAVIIAFALGILFQRWLTESSAGSSGSPGGEAPGAQQAGLPPGGPAELGDPASAGSSSAPRGAPGGAGNSAAPAGGEPRSGLYDPANRFTVQAITYPLSKRDLAERTWRHFLDLGFEAFQPHVHGDQIVVLVGAEPTSAELEPVQKKVRSSLDPDGRRDGYRSAFIRRKDQLGIP